MVGGDPRSYVSVEGRQLGVDAESVDTDDIPIKSWEKWAVRNAILKDIPHISWAGDFPGAAFEEIASGAGSTAVASFLTMDAPANSGNASTAETRFRFTSDSVQADAYEIAQRDWDDEWWWAANYLIQQNDDQRTDYLALGNRPWVGKTSIGFKLDSEKLMGFVHDGTSETTTGAISSAPGTGMVELTAHFRPGDTCEFWVGDVTVGSPDATLSSGLPSGARSDGTIMGEHRVTNNGNDVRRTGRIAELMMGVVA
jgi:hypothetical protein